MNLTKTQLSELLFRYAEGCESNRNELSNEERECVEKWIEESEDARIEIASIRKHLRLLSGIQSPAPSPDLAARCLEAIQKTHDSQKIPRSYWIWASACAMLLIFLTGVWFGQNRATPKGAPFMQLIEAQDYFIGRLEIGLAKCYEEESLTPTNPWYQPIQSLKSANRQFTAAYEINEGDPVIERGLSLAVSQNISLLKSLCDYVENKKSIPDSDVRLFDTDDMTIDSSI